VVVVGGFKEIQKSQPKVYKFHLRNRKGFVKIALETGASLVPAISFGEVDVFEPNANKFLIKLLRMLGIPNIKSPTPLRRPIITVIGPPIDVIKSQQPTTIEIDELHAVFCERIVKLFNEHKLNYCENYHSARVAIE
jgi:2-acylglycerol O-acyltransferase 2